MLINFNHLKTFYSALVQKIKGFRGNWNQNDPTADDYIQNRPFYSEKKEMVILPDTTINVEEPYSELNGMFSIKLVDGQTYIVTYDGVEYTCVAKSTYENEPFIGNSSIIGWNDNIDTGEPFFIDVWNNREVTFAATTAGVHTIRINCFSEIVHKLDKKFIDMPDGIVTEDDLAPVAFTNSYDSLDNTPTIYSDVVRYATTQSLTDSQKTQSRSNIDAISMEDVYEYSINDLTYEPPESTNGLDSLNFNAFNFYKVSDYTPDPSEIIGDGITYRTDGTSYSSSINVGTGCYGLGAIVVVTNANGACSLSVNGNGYNYINRQPPSNGVYLDCRSHVSKVVITAKVVTGMKHLPEGSNKLATEEYVNSAISAIPTPDLTGYATEEYVKAYIDESILGGAW